MCMASSHGTFPTLLDRSSGFRKKKYQMSELHVEEVPSCELVHRDIIYRVIYSDFYRKKQFSSHRAKPRLPFEG